MHFLWIDILGAIIFHYILVNPVLREPAIYFPCSCSNHKTNLIDFTTLQQKTYVLHLCSTKLTASKEIILLIVLSKIYWAILYIASRGTVEVADLLSKNKIYPKLHCYYLYPNIIHKGHWINTLQNNSIIFFIFLIV